MLVKVCSIIVLHECSFAVIEVKNAMGEKVFLVVKVNFLGRDACNARVSLILKIVFRIGL